MEPPMDVHVEQEDFCAAKSNAGGHEWICVRPRGHYPLTGHGFINVLLQFRIADKRGRDSQAETIPGL